MKIRLLFNIRLISKDNFKCYNKLGRYFLSNKFKKWEEAVKWNAYGQLAGQKIPLFPKEDLKMEIIAYYKNKKHCDALNAGKSIGDALKGILYTDDRQIKQAGITVFENTTDELFTIEVEEWEGKLQKMTEFRKF